MKTTQKVGQLFDPSFEGMDLKQIQDNLDGIAYDVKEGKYTKRLTPTEVQECEKQYAYLSIEKADVKAELDLISKMKKAEIKDIEGQALAELEKIKSKSDFVDGTLYHVMNEEEKEMEIYDETGVCIEVRPLRREERQKKIFSITDKTASNGN